MNAYKDDELVARGEGPLPELSEFAKKLLEHGKANRVELFTESLTFKERVANLEKYGSKTGPRSPD